MNPTSLETALAHYLKTGEQSNVLLNAMEDGDEIHAMVEIAIVPDLSKSSLDGVWINYTRNSRLGMNLEPGENLTRFFTFLNVHPRDVLTKEDLSMTPVEEESRLSNSYRDAMNRQNGQAVKQLIDLLTGFEIDPTRPALCTAEIVRIILENTGGYGGYPLIAGWARMSEIMELDFSKPVRIDGLYQVGIHDNVNGCGHMESANISQLELNLARGDLIVCNTKGYTPNSTFDFVGRYYRLELSTARETSLA